VNLLITLYYNAELGGLHDNVFATAIEAKSEGYNVYVACRSGLFNERLKEAGINTITVNQNNIMDITGKVKSVLGDEIDLIHTHPGNGRIAAVRLSKEYNIPIIYHVHGAWNDGINIYIEHLDSVFVVSESVKQRIIELCGGYEEKIHVIPNYSDYNYSNDSYSDVTNTISLITRIDNDKTLILEEFYKLIPYFNSLNHELKINIIGDGTQRKEFLNKLHENITNEFVEINFIGWISDKKLLESYIKESKFIIGPGRVAIDAFTLNRPVIVVGSANYQGIITNENWQHIAANNFGGFGKNVHDYNICDDVDQLLNNHSVYKTSTIIGQQIIKNFFDKSNTLSKHFMIYNILTKKLF